MKRTLFQLFNLLMVGVVLLSSTGFGLVEHTCQMRGKKKTMVVAFSEVNPQAGCAAHQSSKASGQTVVDTSECCQNQHSYENIDASSSLSQFIAKIVKSITETVITAITTVLTWAIDWLFARKSSLTVSFLSPPSLSGRDILTLVRSLLL